MESEGSPNGKTLGSTDAGVDRRRGRLTPKSIVTITKPTVKMVMTNTMNMMLMLHSIAKLVDGIHLDTRLLDASKVWLRQLSCVPGDV